MENKKGERRRAEEMYPVIERYLDRNQTQRDFCGERGINQWVFSYWFGRYWFGRYRSERQAASNGFEVIALSADRQVESGIELEYPNGIKLRIAGGVSVGYLPSLLEIKL